MIWSLLVLVLASVGAWLLYRFRLRKAYTRQQVRVLLFPFFLISMILIANGLAVYYSRSRLAYLVETPFVRDAEEFSALKKGDKVLLRGTLFPTHLIPDSEYLVEVECDGKTCKQTIPKEGLAVDIKDGQVVVTNSDFSALNWPETGEGRISKRSLKAGDSVIIYGAVESVPEVSGEGVISGKMQADLVFAGGGDAFRAEAQRSAILPRFILVTSLFAAVVIALFPIIAWPEFG